MIKADTKVHSLYGSPVAHSLSPVIFNTTFQQLSLNRAYLPFEVSRDNLKQAVEAARTLGFDGFNVTMPHKTGIVEMMDRLDKTAEKIGAVNTVTTTKSGLVGYNTDGEGAIGALRSYGFEPHNKRILVLGAGGAAQALVNRLSSENNNIRILNRILDKARQVADKATGTGRISYGELDKSSLEKGMEDVDLLVNATPIRTSTLISQFKIPADKVKDIGWVFDLAYDQPDKPLSVGSGTISPLEMLVHQAALSYEIWLSETAPFDLMRSSLVDYIGKDWR